MNMNHPVCMAAYAALSFLIAGCGVREETIVVAKVDVMNQVRSTLQNYVKGQPVTSEVTSYEYMVNELRKDSAEKADILKAGLEEIKSSSGAALKSKAKALMQKLGLETGADKN